MTQAETKVRVSTSMGDIVIKLYNDTPQHRDNFLKLVNDGTYEGLLFHRVINEFMIQGGDVTSKDAPMGKQLGSGDLGYTVPAEFVYPKRFHKKGALSAARTGDAGNPLKASSASQFYIVTGKVMKENEIEQMEKQKENQLLHAIFGRLQEENRQQIMAAYKSGDQDELEVIRQTLIAKAELEVEKRKDEAKFTPEQLEAYTTVGGTPFLDNEYTVYGEVTEGLDVVDAIQEVETNSQDRPLQNVVINSMTII